MTLLRRHAVFTLANADLMAAMLAEWGEGQILEKHRWSIAAEQLASALPSSEYLLLIGDEANVSDVDWAAVIEHIEIGARGTMVTLRSVLPLYGSLRLNSMRDASNGARLSKRIVSSYLPCTLSEDDAGLLLQQMRDRDRALAALKKVHTASSEEWRKALLKIQNEVTDGQRAMLSAHAQAPQCTASKRTLSRLGRTGGGVVTDPYIKLGKSLALALGLTDLPHYFDVVCVDWGREDVTLRRPLAEALLKLGWVKHVGQESAVSDSNEALREEAARTIESDPMLKNESSTVKEALVLARLGQGGYRERVLRLWGGRC